MGWPTLQFPRGILLLLLRKGEVKKGRRGEGGRGEVPNAGEKDLTGMRKVLSSLAKVVCPL